MAKQKLKIEPIVKEIVHDFATQYMIQLELQDIYNSLNRIKRQPTIIYIGSQEEIESLEDEEYTMFPKDLFHESV